MALPPHKPPQYAAHILRVALKGHALLSSPRLNKGSAFPLRERHALGLVGRLPYRPNTIDEQCARVYAQLQDRETPLRKNTFLQSVKDQNWTLYYALLARHLKELVPIIYTPTEVCLILLSLQKKLLISLFRQRRLQTTLTSSAARRGCTCPSPTMTRWKKISLNRPAGGTSILSFAPMQRLFWVSEIRVLVYVTFPPPSSFLRLLVSDLHLHPPRA